MSVTLHIGKLLEDEGYGTLVLDGWDSSIGDSGIFYEGIPIKPDGKDAQGVWIMSRQGSVNRVNVGYQPFDIYARFQSPLKGSSTLKSILKTLQESYSGVCVLPTVPGYSETVYHNCRIMPVSGLQNVGQDSVGNTVWNISGEIRFNVTEVTSS